MGAELDRRGLEIPEPVRQVGSHHVTAHLHKGVTATLTVEVRAVGSG